MRTIRSIAGVGSAAIILVGALSMPGTAATTAQESMAQESIDWLNTTPYIDHGGRQGWFRVMTNAATFSGVEKGSFESLVPENWFTPEENAGSALGHGLWPKRCEPLKQQTAAFSRSVYLPGAPFSLKASVFSMLLDDGMKNPLRSIELVINGTQVLEYTTKAPSDDTGSPAHVGPLPDEDSRALVDLTSLAAPVLKYGQNKITFRAVKRATKKTAGLCRGDSSWALAGEVFAQFRADVSATHSGDAVPAAQLAIGKVTVTNDGPSHNPLPARVSVSATSEQVTVKSVTLSGGSTDCSSGPSGTGGGIHASCALPVLGPGETATFDVKIEWTHREGNYKIIVSTQGPGYGEVNYSNNNHYSDICNPPGSTYCASP